MTALPERAAGGKGDPQVVLSTVNSKLSSPSAWRSAAAATREGATAHGVKYARQADKGDDEVTVTFDDGGHGAVNAFILTLRDFSAIAGGEQALARLIDGITENIAAGPRPMPEHGLADRRPPARPLR